MRETIVDKLIDKFFDLLAGAVVTIVYLSLMAWVVSMSDTGVKKA